MNAVVTRLGIDVEDQPASNANPPFQNPQWNSQPEPSNRVNDAAAAPVFVIRDLATEIGIESPSAIRSAHSIPTAREPDLIEEGLVSTQEAFAMFKMSVLFPFVCEGNL